MKKLIAILLVLVMCLAIVSCNNAVTETPNNQTTPEDSTPEDSTPENTPPEIVAPETLPSEPDIISPAEKYSMGEKVSTNIVDFTLIDSTFTYYVSNASNNYGEPTDKSNPMFAAKVGTCYVSMTVTIKNNDRSGSLDFCGRYWNPGKWTVNYNGETYQMYGFDLSSNKYPSVKLNWGGALVDPATSEVISKVGSSNKLISAGEEYTIRFFGIIHVEPSSLNDSFELNITIPNSASEYESFTYTVSN